MDITAKSLVLTAPRRLEWTREQLADPAPGMVVVQTVAGAISIGSELPQYAGKARGAEPPRYPRMPGYESVGVVVAIGEAGGRRPVGERVVGFYGHRTAGLVPAGRAQ